MERRRGVTALINGFGAFAGSYGVGLLQAHTGNPRAGFLLMSAALIVAGLIIAFLRWRSRSSSTASAAFGVMRHVGRGD